MTVLPPASRPAQTPLTSTVTAFQIPPATAAPDPVQIARDISSSYQDTHNLSSTQAQALQNSVTTVLNRFVDDGHLDRGTDYANRLNRSTRGYYLEQTQAHTLQALGELVAIAQTGYVSPNSISTDGNKHAVQAHDNARVQARAIIDAALTGRIDIATLPDNLGKENVFAATRPAGHDDNTPRPTIILYARDAGNDYKSLSSPASDSHDVISLFHEGIHALDDIDGTPIIPNDPNVNWSDIHFNAEYKAWYAERQLTHYQSDQPAAHLQALARDITNVLTQQTGGYQAIWEGYQYDMKPFHARVDMITEGLLAGRDITPDTASRILAAADDKSAQAEVAKCPILTAPNGY